MKMWVRSQNKEKLVSFEEYEFKDTSSWEQEQEGNSTYCIFGHRNSGDRVVLGVYTSEERCIEILDEMQKKCIGTIYEDYDKAVAASLPVVYEMPIA